MQKPIDNNWYRYNDAMVNQIKDLQKEVIDFGTPYILFYQKIINNENLILLNYKYHFYLLHILVNC